MNLSMILEKFNGLRDRHLKDVVNRFSSPFHFKAFSSVPFPVTNVARDPHVGKEVHLQLDRPPATASFATTAFDVETEVPRLVAPLFGQFCVGKEGPDFVKHFGVGSRIGSWRTADRGLVDDDDFVHVFNPLQRCVPAGEGFGPVYVSLECGSQNARHQR